MIQLTETDGIATLLLDRPERRNALSLAMVDRLLEALEAASDARIIVLRGAGGHFCAGGDIADMQAAAADGLDGIAKMNRRFGDALERFDAAPQPIVAVCEGAVMGGGFGLACVADVTLAGPTARFRLPETSLGISPAQIAPFIVQRVGLPAARRLAVTGESLSSEQAERIGLCQAVEDIEVALAALLRTMRRCEPGAVRATKALVRRVGQVPRAQLLDEAATDFARLATRPEASEGMGAFLARRDPPWA